MRLGLALLVAGALTLGLPGPVGARQLIFLDNDQVKVGVDLDEGGAITFVSRGGGSETDNLVNDHDFGRQVQQSYYAGPEGLGVPCSGFGTGWNPIGTGDCHGHPSAVLSASNDGRTIYVKSTPLQWAFDHVPCECMFEQWITLDGPAVVVRNRLTNARSDHTLYPAQDQELPAVYTVGRLGRQFTYEGLVPWTNGPLTEIFGTLPAAVQVLATEHWAANVDASGFGLGVFQPEVNTFIAGFHGRRGVGGAFDDDTGYISPIRPEQLDWNIVYDYPYSLVVGTVEEIRAYAVSHRPPAPSWQFTTSREGFSLVNASDTGFPIHDLLRVRLNQADPQAWSPPSFWRAEDVPAVDVRMALHGTSADRAEAFWAVDGRGFSGSQRDAIAVVPDGAFHTYRIPLAGAAGYTGAITRFRFDPIVTGETPGAYAEIDAITPIVQPLIPLARTVTLTLTKKLARGLITVNDGDAACAQKVPAVLERRSRGWRRVASGVTDSAGRFRIRFRGGGVYRVRASETLRAAGRCLAAVSPVRRR